jgi:dTMP kinase
VDALARGRFIVFEGLDCSGSSTQANLLYERLIAEGKRAWLTSEPSSGPIGHLIRLFFSGRIVLPSSREVRDRQFAFLFAADRFDHLHNPTNGILKHLDDGIDVICTRYVISSLAYNVENLQEEEFVLRLNADFPEPDFVIYLDCAPELSMQRMNRARATRDTYENIGKLDIVYGNYERSLMCYQGTKLRVPADLPRHEISERVFSFVAEHRGIQQAVLFAADGG